LEHKKRVVKARVKREKMKEENASPSVKEEPEVDAVAQNYSISGRNESIVGQRQGTSKPKVKRETIKKEKSSSSVKKEPDRNGHRQGFTISVPNESIVGHRRGVSSHSVKREPMPEESLFLGEGEDADRDAPGQHSSIAGIQDELAPTSSSSRKQPGGSSRQGTPSYGRQTRHSAGHMSLRSGTRTGDLSQQDSLSPRHGSSNTRKQPDGTSKQDPLSSGPQTGFSPRHGSSSSKKCPQDSPKENDSGFEIEADVEGA